MHQTIADDKNAYKKIQRMLEYQTNLDAKVKYATEPLLDEELEAEVEGGTIAIVMLIVVLQGRKRKHPNSRKS